MTNLLNFTFSSTSDPQETTAAVAAMLPMQPVHPQRLLLLSDVHGNWPALYAVLEDAVGRYDAIWFLGDMVGYGPFPVECLTFWRTYMGDDRWRAGNHDIGLFDRLPGFTWSGAAGTTLALQRTLLEQAYPDLWQWFSALAILEQCGPLVQTQGRGQQVWTHANLENDLSLYLFPAATYQTRKNLWRLREFLPQPGQSGWLLAGHTHIPCLFHLPITATDFLAAQPQTIRWGEPVAVDQGHYYINPGSVGQPRDGNPTACYALLDLAALTVTWRRVRYPIHTTIAELFRLQYPKTLAAMLEQGGTARTIEELQPYYTNQPDGLYTASNE